MAVSLFNLLVVLLVCLLKNLNNPLIYLDMKPIRDSSFGHGKRKVLTAEKGFAHDAKIRS